MAKFNPDFWEVTISHESWQQFPCERSLHYRPHEETDEHHAWSAKARQLWPAVQQILEDVLTPRQREIVMLYFFEGLNQRQISERLGLAQQVVSAHLYGKIRDGHAVGGALRKLRKECETRGIRLDEIP
jgi:DNA-binding CsgD family transcriptional regulator